MKKKKGVRVYCYRGLTLRFYGLGWPVCKLAAWRGCRVPAGIGDPIGGTVAREEKEAVESVRLRGKERDEAIRRCKNLISQYKAKGGIWRTS